MKQLEPVYRLRYATKEMAYADKQNENQFKT